MFSHELLNIVSNQSSRFSGDGNKWQQMAANGSFLATSWQLMGIKRAADGCRDGSKWQRIGS